MNGESLTSHRLQTALLAGLVVFTLFALFWNLGSAPLYLWDESRYGVNAFEMAVNRDFVNYSFQGHLDLWPAKPPLQVWSIVAFSKVLGFNAWSLRLPSAIAGLVTVVFIYLIARFWGGSLLGLLAAWIAVTCKGFIGPHVTRTGEPDALFVAGIAIAVYFFLRAMYEGQAVSWLGFGVALGISFLAKGFAVLLVGPAFLIAFFVNDWRSQIREKLFYFGITVFLMFPAGWLFVLHKYGMVAQQAVTRGPEDMVGVLVWWEIVGRFLGTRGDHVPWSPQAIFSYLDVGFSPWYYLILFFIVIGLIKRRKSLLSDVTLFHSLRTCQHSLVFSAVFTGSLLIIVALSVGKANWYIAPIVITFPFLLLGLFDLVSNKNKIYYYGIFLTLALGGARIAIDVMSDKVPSPFEEQVKALMRERNDDALEKLVMKTSRDDELLYLYWTGAKSFTATKIEN